MYAYEPASKPGGKMHLFDTGVAHSKPPHNITIVKVSLKSITPSVSICSFTFNSILLCSRCIN